MSRPASNPCSRWCSPSSNSPAKPGTHSPRTRGNPRMATPLARRHHMEPRRGQPRRLPLPRPDLLPPGKPHPVLRPHPRHHRTHRPGPRFHRHGRRDRRLRRGQILPARRRSATHPRRLGDNSSHPRRTPARHPLRDRHGQRVLRDISEPRAHTGRQPHRRGAGLTSHRRPAHCARRGYRTHTEISSRLEPTGCAGIADRYRIGVRGRIGIRFCPSRSRHRFHRNPGRRDPRGAGSAQRRSAAAAGHRPIRGTVHRV